MRKGISLIVLVITIIVMIILAASVVITLSNTGVINRASEAVDATNQSQVQDLAALIWADAYMDDKRDDDLRDAVIEELRKQGVTEDKWNIIVTNTGVTISLKNKIVWELKSKKDGSGKIIEVYVTNGDEKIDVGSKVNYTVNGYAGDWNVLGADDDGRLLIMSTAEGGVGTATLSASTLAEAETNYINILTTLNNTAGSYADGEIGILSRCVTIEDINTITGYNPKTYEESNFMDPTYSGAAAGVEVYEKEVAFTLGESGGVSFSWNNGTSDKTGNLETNHPSGFLHYDILTNTFNTIDSSTNASARTVNLTHKFYGYMGESLLATTTKAYKMIFGDSYVNYTLASRFVNCNSSEVKYGLFMVGSPDVGAFRDLIGSTGSFRTTYLDFVVRAVVTLADDVQLKESNVPGVYNID